MYIENGTENRERRRTRTEDALLPGFEWYRPYISAFPACMDAGAAEDPDTPVCTSHGENWEFVMRNPEDPTEFAVVTGDIAEEWVVSSESLMKAAEENLERFLPHIGFSVLFGKVSETVTVPFLLVSFSEDAEYPPAGASIYLLDEVPGKIRRIIGSHYLFIANAEEIYAVPDGSLKKNRLNPSESFFRLYGNRTETNPRFNPLFPELGKDGKGDGAVRTDKKSDGTDEAVREFREILERILKDLPSLTLTESEENGGDGKQ